MRLEQCVRGYMTAAALENREWDYKMAHGLMMIKNRMKPHAEFYAREEKKLAEEYAARDDRGEILWAGNGAFRFARPEEAEEYSRRREELGATEVEEEFRRLRVPEPEKIRPAHLEALHPFLLFGEEEEE